MNYPEIENVINHIQKNCKCLQCHNKYKLEDIHVVATTVTEGLFETRCKKCDSSAVITVLIGPEISTTRQHKGISKNDILDMKNFLNKFDGNFKKIFINIDQK